MEEIERKLNSNNPMLVAQIVSTLVKNLRKKGLFSNAETAKLNFLKSKCLDSDPLVAEVATFGVLKLVEDGVLEVDLILADFVTSIPIAKCVSSLRVCRALGQLLYLEAKKKIKGPEKQFISHYNLNYPKHPFIMVLNEIPSSSEVIFNEIKYLYHYSDLESLSYCATKLLKPVFLYTFCNPTEKGNLNYFKLKLWNFLVRDTNNEGNSQIFEEIISWMNLTNKDSLLVNSELIHEHLRKLDADKPSYQREVFILAQMTILSNLILNNLDPRSSLDCLKGICEETEDLHVTNCLLLMVSKVLTVASPIYLLDLLKLCKILTRKKSVGLYALQVLKAAILQWISNAYPLFSPANTLANELFVFINKFHEKPRNIQGRDLWNLSLKTVTNPKVNLALKLCLLWEAWTDPTDVISWLEALQKAPQFFIRNIIQFLYGLFLEQSEQVSLKAFVIIESCAENYNEIQSQVLTLILYKLSNVTDSKLHMVLLNALPKLAASADNFQRVVATLEALNNGPPALQNLSMLLMFETWKINQKCYVNLEKQLVKPGERGMEFETYTTKAYILRQLCYKKPEVYGKDIVAHLSRVLNECKDETGGLPSLLAIEGIVLLCKAGIIDVVTTWANLEPMFKDDTRIPVKKSLCGLIRDIPTMPYHEAYTEDELKSVVKTLWNYIVIHEHQDVVTAALDALTAFSLEQISQGIPNEYLSENTIQLRKNNAKNALFKVPGDTWVTLMKKLQNHLTAVGDFVIKMITKEVAGYLKHTYHVKGAKEPSNFQYLPVDSVVRAVGEFLRTQYNKWENDEPEVYLECLRIFSKKYPKPLPPLDWRFLTEVFHVPSTTNLVMDLASHQVILSETARRFIENYILENTDNFTIENSLIIYSNFKYLANSIQPLVLKPFVKKTFKIIVENDPASLEPVVDKLREVLGDSQVQEANKAVLSKIISQNILETEDSSPLFQTLLKCVNVFPTDHLQELTKLKYNQVAEDDWLLKIIEIRCSLAIHSKNDPMSWLNQIIEHENLFHIKHLIFAKLLPVFHYHVNNTGCALWLLDLMGQIQTDVAHRAAKEHISYLLDILLLAVAVFSGYFSFVESTDHLRELQQIFPVAFAALLEYQHWSICTNEALEWLYFMNMDETVPINYRIAFGQTLQCLRHNEEFGKNIKWMKYMSCNVNLE